MSTEKKDIKHPEWETENSLTAPSDRNPDRSYKPNQGHRNLSEDEVVNAMETLNNNSYVKQFLKVERRYADPVDPMQRVGLISFVPARGATPNDKGIYGFAKLRGNFATNTEANEKAEYLIRNVDSYHQIYHSYVGRPFPLCTTSDYSGESVEIDIRKNMKESISDNIKKQKKEEMKTMDEIKEREKELIEDTSKEEQDPEDVYTTLRVKKAQLSWTYLETMKKIEEIKESIIKTRKEIEEMDQKDSSYKDVYLNKYLEARKQTGLDVTNMKDSFMKYMVEDAELPF